MNKSTRREVKIEFDLKLPNLSKEFKEVVERPISNVFEFYNNPSILDYLINLNYDIILKTLDYSKVPVKILTNENFLTSYDMSLVKYNKHHGIIMSIKELGKFVPILNVGNLQEILFNGELSESYKDVVIGKYSNKLASVAESNFISSKDGNKLATKDFRILLYDKKGNIPSRVMQHAATVALLILSGNCDLSLGLSHIQDVMKKYGYAEFVFHMNGFCQIVIGDKPKLNYKANVAFNNQKSI